MRDVSFTSKSGSSRGGILGKQHKVILEGPREALQDGASLPRACPRWAANHPGLGVAAHARHQQVRPRVGLPVAPVAIVNQLRVGVQQQETSSSPACMSWLAVVLNPAAVRATSQSLRLGNNVIRGPAVLACCTTLAST
jgi:hypothetical protein